MPIKNLFSDRLHQEKYRQPGETFEGAMQRIAKALADNNTHEIEFYKIIHDMRFLPAGRVQSAMGADKQVTAFNCFVSPDIKDSFADGEDSIMDVALKACKTMRMGGGIGYNFSTLRPRGAEIKKLRSSSSGPIAFMDIFDAICRSVSSSGHRRGAQMGVLNIDHPDIEEFIKVKTDLNKLTGFNISVGVTDEFMDCLKHKKPFNLQFEGKVYKTVDPEYLWDLLMRTTYDYAEPGVLFLDRINEFNNLYYCEKIMTTNPCLAEGTLVSTPKGLIPVERIKQGDLITTIDGARPVRTVEAHNDIDVFEVELTDGSVVKATADHIFHVVRNKKIDKSVRLRDLKIGDKLRLAAGELPNERMVATGTPYTERELGVLVGATIGDGCFTDNSPGWQLSFYDKETTWIDYVTELVQRSHPERDVQPMRKSTSTVEIKSTKIGELLERIGLERGYSHTKELPLTLLNTNKEFLKGFIDGLLSTDGNVNLSSSHVVVRCSSTNKNSMMMLKRALNCFGVLARVYAASGKKAGGSRVIQGSDIYELIITGSEVKKLYTEIGLSNPVKKDKLKKAVYEHSLTGCLWMATIKSITPIGKATVYDLFEPVTDTWITEGIVNLGCGEQPLGPNAACLLGSFNLVRYIKEDRTFDYAQFKADIAPVVRAMDNVIDRTEYPLPEQEAKAKSTRRMGLGVTALANAVELMGFPYGTPGFITATREILTILRDETYTQSALLAKEKGAFPDYIEKLYIQGEFIKTLPAAIRELIQENGVRNSHLTSIAPTGTISLCADNVSSGIEPVFSYEGERLVNMPEGQITVQVRDYAYANFNNFRGRKSTDVSVDEHLAVLAVAAELVDSAVSKTLNLDKTTDMNAFKDIYVKAYEAGCKGCTTFNKDGKRFGILIDNDEACVYNPETGVKSCE